MTIATIGTTKKLAIIHVRFVFHIKNNMTGKTHKVAQIVGTINSFVNFLDVLNKMLLLFFNKFIFDINSQK